MASRGRTQDDIYVSMPAAAAPSAARSPATVRSSQADRSSTSPLTLRSGSVPPSMTAAALRTRSTTGIYDPQLGEELEEHHDYFVGSVGGDLANGRGRKFLTAHTRRMSSTDLQDFDFEAIDFDAARAFSTVVSSGSSSGSLSSTSEEEGPEDSKSDMPSDGSGRTLLGGLQRAHPEMYNWLFDRIGNRQKVMLALIFIVAESAKFHMFEYAVTPDVNMYSVFLACDTVSATLGLAVSIGLEGRRACKCIFNPHGLSRIFVMALFFTLSTGLIAGALQTGISPVLINLLGKLYLPFAAIASYFAFKRSYGLLEWLALSMTMLSIAAFTLLRDRCHYYYCHELSLGPTETNFAGSIIVICSVAFSATASILMERVLQKKGNFAKKADYGYYIYRTQLDLTTSMFWLVCLLFLTNHAHLRAAVEQEQTSQTAEMDSTFARGWFGVWTKRQYFLVAILIAQRWLAGLMVMRFSTVSRGIISSLSTVFVVMIGDWLESKFAYGARFVPSILITTIVCLSGVIFQTGRLNIIALRHRIEAVHSTNSRARDWVTPSHLANVVRDNMHTQFERMNSTKGGFKAMILPFMKYSIIVYYILADSARNILGKVVQNNRFIVPQTMAMMSPVLGMLFASVMVLQSEGCSGLRRAWDIRKVGKFSLCGLLSALTQSMLSSAFALGTSPSLVVGLGKIYTPVVALMSRYILGRFFFWMEWFALIILTCSAVAFSFLQNIGSSVGRTDSDMYGMLLVVGSSICSAIMSLVMERFMKGETEPFIVQKVRLDAGGFLFSLILLPLMGWIATMPGNSRQDLAFWSYRPGPDYWPCYELAVNYPEGAIRGCDQATGQFMPNMTLIGNSTALLAQADKCMCGNGVFLGWGDNLMIYVFMIVAVFHSWIVGKLVCTFSSVDRAVADGIPLLLIFFFLDPLASRVPLDSFRAAYNHGPMMFPPPDYARDLVCLILPLSGWTFSSATTQMNKAIDNVAQMEDSSEDAAEAEEGAGSDRSAGSTTE